MDSNRLWKILWIFGYFYCIALQKLHFIIFRHFGLLLIKSDNTLSYCFFIIKNCSRLKTGKLTVTKIHESPLILSHIFTINLTIIEFFYSYLRPKSAKRPNCSCESWYGYWWNWKFIVPTPHVGSNYILKWFLFVQTILADRYIHRREKWVVSLKSSSSVQFEVKKLISFFFEDFSRFKFSCEHGISSSLLFTFRVIFVELTIFFCENVKSKLYSTPLNKSILCC